MITKSERFYIRIGALVTCVAVGLFGYTTVQKPLKVKRQNGYTLEAFFNRTDGLATGAEVRLAGIPVGAVFKQELVDHYRSKVILSLKENLALPDDSGAVIQTDGLFGDKYIELEPGGSIDYLENGDTIQFTQDSLIVEELLDRIISMAKSKKEKEKAQNQIGPVQPDHFNFEKQEAENEIEF